MSLFKMIQLVNRLVILNQFFQASLRDWNQEFSPNPNELEFLRTVSFSKYGTTLCRKHEAGVRRSMNWPSDVNLGWGALASDFLPQNKKRMPLSCAKRSLIGARAKRIEQTRRHKTRDRSLKGATRDRCKILSPALHLERKVHFSARTNSYVLSVE